MATALTWYTDANYAFPATATGDDIDRSALWTLKAYLQQQIVGVNNGPNGTAPAGAAWTCMGSSDAATAGMDGVDRWGTTFDAAKIKFNAPNRSWIVLRSPNDVAGPGTGYYYLLLDCNDTGFTAGGVAAALSQTPYTGGSTTTSPTTTSPARFSAASPSFVNPITAGNYYAHIARTASGAFYYAGFRQGSTSMDGAFFGTVPLLNQDAVDQWKLFGLWYNGGSGDVGSSTAMAGAAGGNTGWRIAARTYTLGADAADSNYLVYTGSRTNGGTAQGIQQLTGLNNTTNTYPAYPLGVFTDIVGSRGVRGTLPDVYTIGTGRTVGDTAPGSGPQEYVCSPLMLIPFNCAVLV